MILLSKIQIKIGGIKMHVTLTRTDEIYSRKTREYFDEVLSSYSNGNYRSAIVMLYSVTIFDLMSKLKELSDKYSDEKSRKLLDKINKSRLENGKSKSSWEKELVDSLYNDTEFLNLEQYTQLNHLYEYRNFCAHPALTEDNELITPSKEITIANIKIILENILIKPPIFIKDIFDSLTEDLESKADEFEGLKEYEYLKNYLINKYFLRMNDNMIKKIFESLWKITFISKDQRCQKNRRINRKAISVLFEYKKSILDDLLKGDDSLNVMEFADDESVKEMVFLLSDFPKIYNYLSEYNKRKIVDFVKSNESLRIISWFMEETKEDHLKSLYEEKDIVHYRKYMEYLIYKYENEGLENELLELFIHLFDKSSSYDYTDIVYDEYIKPRLEKFSKEQAVRIISSVNSNPQIRSRNRAKCTNLQMKASFAKILDKDFDYRDYPRFEIQ